MANVDDVMFMIQRYGNEREIAGRWRGERGRVTRKHDRAAMEAMEAIKDAIEDLLATAQAAAYEKGLVENYG